LLPVGTNKYEESLLILKGIFGNVVNKVFNISTNERS